MPAPDRHDILAEIRRRGQTLTGLARAAGIERSACTVALCRPHPAGERAIADFLGSSVEELWPARAEKRRRAESRFSRKRHRRACQIRGHRADTAGLQAPARPSSGTDITDKGRGR